MITTAVNDLSTAPEFNFVTTSFADDEGETVSVCVEVTPFSATGTTESITVDVMATDNSAGELVCVFKICHQTAIIILYCYLLIAVQHSITSFMFPIYVVVYETCYAPHLCICCQYIFQLTSNTYLVFYQCLVTTHLVQTLPL